MKVYILVDDQKIVRCLASDECNLHKDKLSMKKYHVEREGTIGDEYDSKAKKWIARPENYPSPSGKEQNEMKINQEIRRTAIEALKSTGQLPPDYE
ncbi:hypothetical protein KKH23_06660 [Patescibacteria group bacterium]|nr:hypothetical protein [Patescibacteria group bacterium]